MSKIEVNKIGPQCGTTLTVSCGSGQTVTVDADTVTLGRSGGTVSLASGATQSGFGRTGTVDWQTTPRTASFTAADGEGYFVNTTSGAITMTMPSGSAGAIVAIQDYNKTFDTNALTITPASGEKINGGEANGLLVISTEGQGITFVYVDSTVGWKTVYENDFTAGGSVELIATGGTITTCGDCKVHTFTSPGTFTVSQLSSTPANNLVSYMVVAGGGGGGGRTGGGGGAGGAREYKSPVTPYVSSPLDGNPSNPAGGGTSVTVTATSFPITVGGGGTGGPGSTNQPGTDGSNSVFSTITSTGGGGGAGACCPTPSEATGRSGGSGGGGGYIPGPGPSARQPGGSGNTPPVSPSQGNNGGIARSTLYAGGGGGGATAVGAGGNPSAGGAGATSSISFSPTAYGGGGGGGSYQGSGTPIAGGAGGTGGGGAGSGQGTPACGGVDGTANTGGGGGGGGGAGNKGLAGDGGSGIVIIRYKFQ